MSGPEERGEGQGKDVQNRVVGTEEKEVAAHSEKREVEVKAGRGPGDPAASYFTH